VLLFGVLTLDFKGRCGLFAPKKKDLMGYYWDFMGFNGTQMEFSGIFMVFSMGFNWL